MKIRELKVLNLLRRRSSATLEEFIILPSPYLNLLSQFLLSLQSEDGSWFQEPLYTSIVLQALHTYFVNTKMENIYHKELSKGIEYLKNELEDFSEKVLSSENLYAGLDDKAIFFGNLFYTVNLIGGRVLSQNKVKLAFKKLEAEVNKYAYSLDNIEAITDIVKCYKFLNGENPPETLLRVILSTFLQSSFLRDTFLAFCCIYTLIDKYPEKLEELYQKEIVRYEPNLKNKTFQETITDIICSKLRKLNENSDLETLAYGLIVATELKVDTHVQKISELIYRKLNEIQFWKNIFENVEGKIDKIKPFLYDISLALTALSSSHLKDSVFLTSSKLNEVVEAIKWYNEKKKRGVILESVREYYLIRVALSISIIFSTFYILSSFISSNVLINIISSVIVSTVCSIIIKLFKKPHIEKELDEP
jgi:hypothetical protein